MQGGTDITASFLAACTRIPHGETVKASNLHMLDAMNALTIGDVRMDTGVRPACGSKREEQEIGVREVCAVIDRLVQNEMAFHSGWAPIPTIFTSRHLLHLSLLQRTASPTPTQRALVGYLECFKRSFALVWQELSKGAVFEGEDWMGDLGGLWGDGEEFGDEGEGCVDVDPELPQQLRLRLEIRQSFLEILTDTISGGTPSQPAENITRLISQLTFDPDASTTSQPFFDKDVPRRFRQAMPVPSVQLSSPAQAYEKLGRIVQGLHWVCEVRDWTVSPSLKARERQAWVFALGPGDEGIDACWPPIVRSCMTWSLMDGFTYPLQQNELLGQWMSEYSQDNASDFNLDRTLYRASAVSMNRLIEVREFFDLLSETIRMGMHDRCQNRPRQHRLCALAAHRWEDLSLSLPMLDVLDDQEKGQLARGLSARRADVVLDALLDEFDLELVDSNELSSVYWFMSRVAQARTLQSGESSKSWRASWASAWANIAQAIHLALSATIESPQEQQNDHHARAVFEHRSAPLQLKNPSSMAENDAYSYDAYKKSRTAARKVSRDTLRANIQVSCMSAKDAFARVRQQLETTNVGPGVQQRKSAQEHQAICEYLENTVEAYIKAEIGEDKLSLVSRAAKWLPPARDIHKVLRSLQ